MKERTTLSDDVINRVLVQYNGDGIYQDIYHLHVHGVWNVPEWANVVCRAVQLPGFDLHFAIDSANRYLIEYYRKKSIVEFTHRGVAIRCLSKQISDVLSVAETILNDTSYPDKLVSIINEDNEWKHTWVDTNGKEYTICIHEDLLSPGEK